MRYYKSYNDKKDFIDLNQKIKNNHNNVDDNENENKIEVDNNNIYFYSDIYRNKILELNKHIKKLNNDLMAKKFGLCLTRSPNIFLHLNSYGGSITSGFAAADSILQSEVPIITIIDGICASAATFLSVVGNERWINKHAVMLIHQLSNSFWGSYFELVDNQKNMDLLMNMIKDLYKQYTKLSMKTLDEIVKHDLYFDAKTCLKYGLVDKII